MKKEYINLITKNLKTGIKENDLNLNKIWDCGKLKFEYIK